MRFKLYFLAALFAIAAAAAHLFAVKYTLYWSLLWFDFPVHFSASVMVGLVSYMVSSWVLPHHRALPPALILVAGVGLTWEVFEYVVGTSYIQAGFFSDTFQDLIADALGGGAGAYLAHYVLRPERTQ